MSRGTEPGFLGVAHRPFTAERPGHRRTCGSPTASPPTGSTTARTCSAAFDDVRRDIDASGTMTGHGRLHRAGPSTWSPSGTVRNGPRPEEAKTRRTRDRYKGVEQFLTARRLVEAGVGCVTLSIGGWDTHGQNFKTLQAAAAAGRPRHRQPDPGPARPRHGRRRGDGDVGRVRPHAEDQQATPAATTGRRSCRRLVAGGGLKMGQAIGASTARGERPKDRPLHACRRCSARSTRPSASTRRMTFPNGSGRPMYILDDREPVQGIAVRLILGVAGVAVSDREAEAARVPLDADSADYADVHPPMHTSSTIGCSAHDPLAPRTARRSRPVCPPAVRRKSPGRRVRRRTRPRCSRSDGTGRRHPNGSTRPAARPDWPRRSTSPT